MADWREPYDPAFCAAIKCKHRAGDKCKIDACIYNHKRVIHWQHTGVLPEKSDG